MILVTIFCIAIAYESRTERNDQGRKSSERSCRAKAKRIILCLPEDFESTLLVGIHSKEKFHSQVSYQIKLYFLLLHSCIEQSIRAIPIHSKKLSLISRIHKLLRASPLFSIESKEAGTTNFSGLFFSKIHHPKCPLKIDLNDK